jgi:hypothetical protein
MKKFLPFMLFMLLPFAGSGQIISCGSPFGNFGLPITFCSQVKGTMRDSLGKNSGTLLFLCGNYPYQDMTVIIKDLTTPIFSYTLEEWIGKQICATGTVKVFKGKKYIEVKKKSQLTVQ